MVLTQTVAAGVEDATMSHTYQQAPPQYLEALAAANLVRKAVADIRRHLRSMDTETGRREAARLLLSVDEASETPLWAGMPIDRFLMAIRRLGRCRIEPLLKVAGIRNPCRRISDLTPRQRFAVADALVNPPVTWH
jgi:hypothetical protein